MESSFQSMDQYYCKYFQLNRLMYNLKCIKENEMYLILPFIHPCEFISSSWSTIVVRSRSASLLRISSLLFSIQSELNEGSEIEEALIAFKILCTFWIKWDFAIVSSANNREGIRSQSTRNIIPNSWGVNLVPPVSNRWTFSVRAFMDWT